MLFWAWKNCQLKLDAINELQSNLCTTIILWATKLMLLLTSGRCSGVRVKNGNTKWSSLGLTVFGIGTIFRKEEDISKWKTLSILKTVQQRRFPFLFQSEFAIGDFAQTKDENRVGQIVQFHDDNSKVQLREFVWAYQTVARKTSSRG